MKKCIGLLLLLALLMSVLAGCGEAEAESATGITVSAEQENITEPTALSDFQMAQSAYADICAAYELVSQMGVDLHNVWRVGAYETDSANRGQYVEYMTPHLNHLTKDEFVAGVARTLAWNAGGKKWDDLSDEEKEYYIKYAKSEFYIKREHFQYFCMSSVLHGYYLTGEADEIKALLKTAKTQLKNLNETYPEYSCYTALKEFYKSVDAYFELCYSDGDGGAGISFNQFKELRGAYIKEVQDHMSELGFEFED